MKKRAKVATLAFFSSVAARKLGISASMWCYFNIIHAGRRVPDDEGCQVTNVEEARAQAGQVIKELRRDDDFIATDWKGLWLEVTDSTGTVLFTMNVEREGQ